MPAPIMQPVPSKNMLVSESVRRNPGFPGSEPYSPASASACRTAIDLRLQIFPALMISPWPMTDTGRLQIVYPAHARSQNFFGRMTQKSCVTKLRNLGQRLGTVRARTPAEPRRTPDMWRSTCCSSDACALCPTGHEDLLEIRRVPSFNATSLFRPTMELPACELSCMRARLR